MQGVQLRVAPCSVLPDDLCPLYPILPTLSVVTVAVETQGGGGLVFHNWWYCRWSGFLDMWNFGAHSDCGGNEEEASKEGRKRANVHTVAYIG